MEEQNNEEALTENFSSDLSMSLLTLRMIMQGKEVGSIIGKKGDNIRKFREESGARISISDASCPERIVTVTGTTDQIVSAITMICKRLEEDVQYSTAGDAVTTNQLITLRFIIPANQCGSLIGKGGAKIKEIRDAAGAFIQISSEMLPNSTERSVTMSGSVESVSRGVFHICSVMLESPPRGTAIPYRPKIATTPVILAGGQTYAVNGQYFISQPDLSSGQPTMLRYHPVPPQYARMVMRQGMMGHAALSPYLPHHAMLAPSYQCGYIRAPSTQGGVVQHVNQTYEINIPNDLIGCIIGRGGSKINEIRQASGANIKIANVDEGSPMRLVTISGTPEAINAAQFLINASLEMPRNMALTLDLNTCSSGSLASSGASLSDLSLSTDLHGLPQSSSNNAANPVNVQSLELNPEENAAAGQGYGAKSMPSFALALKQPGRGVLYSQNPLSSVGFTLVRSPVVPPSSLVYTSNAGLPPRTPSAQCNTLTLTQKPSSFTIPSVVPIINGFNGTGFVQPQRNLASKVKAGICVINKFGQKYFPY